MKPWIERHPVASFYIVTYLFSWSIAVPLAMQAQGAVATRLPMWLHYLTAFGPALGALVVGRLASAHARDLFRRPQAVPWVLVGAISPLALFAASQSIASWFGQPTPTWTDLGRVSFLPALGLWAWPFWVVTSGVGEELGWRGFALGRLQRTHSAFASSLLLSVAWAGWHAPAFFYVPSYMSMGLKIVPGFFLGILAGAIVLTWLYNSSGGSLLAVMLWHASFNFVTASPNAGGFAAAFVSTAVIVWAAASLVMCRWQTLAPRSVSATTLERTESLPGDEIVPRSIAMLTHAITIEASRTQIWPWLLQMGAGRAGWYSYDRLDNGGTPSADVILPALQETTEGTLFPALPGVTDGFLLLKCEREHCLILGWPSARGGQTVSWAFVLRDEGLHRTRLIVRARGSAEYPFYGLPALIGKPLVTFVHFIMERKQLLGIAERAESQELVGEDCLLAEVRAEAL